MIHKVSDYAAIMRAEGAEPCSRDEYIAAWQHLLDKGLCWSLQGWFGRTAINMIADGLITEPKETDGDSETIP